MDDIVETHPPEKVLLCANWPWRRRAAWSGLRRGPCLCIGRIFLGYQLLRSVLWKQIPLFTGFSLLITGSILVLNF